MSFLKEGDKISLMRVIAFLGALGGLGAVVSGLIAMFLGIDGSSTALMTGAGMLATAQGFKMGQKAFEKSNTGM